MTTRPGDGAKPNAKPNSFEAFVSSLKGATFTDPDTFARDAFRLSMAFLSARQRRVRASCVVCSKDDVVAGYTTRGPVGVCCVPLMFTSDGVRIDRAGLARLGAQG